MHSNCFQPELTHFETFFSSTDYNITIRPSIVFLDFIMNFFSHVPIKILYKLGAECVLFGPKNLYTNKYGCTMDQELADAAAYEPGSALIRWQHFGA